MSMQLREADSILAPPASGGRAIFRRSPRTISSRVRSNTAAIIGYLALAAIVVSSLMLVLAANDRASLLSPPSHAAFPHWMSGPFGGMLPGLTDHIGALRTGFTLAVAGMYLAYLVLLACVPRLRVRWTIAAIVAVHVIFFLSAPLSLTDLFNYINYGRMGAVHGLNPYVHIPLAVRHDPAYQFTTWHHLQSPYGPLFTLITYALAPLGVAAAYWVFKALVMVASLGCLLLLWKCATRLGRDPLFAVVFVGMNPLVLVYALGGAHNDVFMMLLVLMGVYLMLSMREALGTAAFTAAVAIKVSAGLLLPVVLLASKRRLHALAGAVAVALAVGVLIVTVFGGHLPNDAAQSKLVSPFSFPNDVGMVIGVGGVTDGMRTILQAILIAAVALGSLAVWRGRNWLVVAGWVTFVLLMTLTWVMPWYVLWLLPFAALVQGRALRLAALVFGVFLMFNWLPLSQNLLHRQLHVWPTHTEVGHRNALYVHRLLK